MKISPINTISYRSSKINHAEEERLDAMLYDYKRQVQPVRTFFEDFSAALQELGFMSPKQIKLERQIEKQAQNVKETYPDGTPWYIKDKKFEKFYDKDGNLFLMRCSDGRELYFYNSGDVWVKKRADGSGVVVDKSGNIIKEI